MVTLIVIRTKINNRKDKKILNKYLRNFRMVLFTKDLRVIINETAMGNLSMQTGDSMKGTG